MTISFRPIELSATADLCVRFREDSFVVSFGNVSGFYEADGLGAERYLAWLKRRQEEDPCFCSHVWLEGEIIGQVEFGPWSRDPQLGYVNLYYLVPEQRGKGWATQMDDFVCSKLKSKGLDKARLSVSATNSRAIRFYERQGWRDIGPRPGYPDVHLMEKLLAAD